MAARRAGTRSRRAASALPVAVAGLVVAVFALLLGLRLEAGFANVDDYLYAAQTSRLFEALPQPGAVIDAWREFGSNTPLVPSLALPLAAAGTSPDLLVLVQVVPLLVLLGSLRVLLDRLGVAERAAWIGAGAITLLAPVMAYAAMYHFALAAAACTALAAAAYAASDGLARRGPSLVLGLALGLLALTRVMAPVYVAALGAAIVVDVLARGGGRAPRLRNGLLGALVGGAVAAPWWIASGGIAWDYLTSAGYGEGVFTRDASVLERAGDRLRWTADESGWLLALPLLAALAWFTALAWRARERLVLWLAGVCLAGMGMLASSTNLGTAFALPFVVLAAAAVAAGIARSPGRVRRPLAAAAAVVVLLPLAAIAGAVPGATVDGRPLWNEGIPAWQQAEQALACDGCDLPDTDALNRDVVRVIGDRRTLIVRADTLLNPNGLRHRADGDGIAARIEAPATPGRVVARDLEGVEHVIAGDTPAPYLPPADSAQLEVALRLAGLEPALERRLSAANSVVVWSRRARR